MPLRSRAEASPVSVHQRTSRAPERSVVRRGRTCLPRRVDGLIGRPSPAYDFSVRWPLNHDHTARWLCVLFGPRVGDVARPTSGGSARQNIKRPRNEPAPNASATRCGASAGRPVPGAAPRTGSHQRLCVWPPRQPHPPSATCAYGPLDWKLVEVVGDARV